MSLGLGARRAFACALAGAALALTLRPAAAAESRRSALARRYAEVARSVRAEVLSPERSPFDPLAVVLREGIDPERLARFVRERIAYEPYAGAVRGPSGTLAAAAGSDWDRALLLRAVLERAGFRARLRALERTPAEREKAVRAFLANADPSPCAALPADPAAAVRSPPPRFLEAAGITERSRLVLAARAASAGRRAMAAAYDFAAAEAPWIESALRGAGESLGRPWEAWRDALLSGAAERLAVEIEGTGGEPLFLEVGPEVEPLGAARWSEAAAFDEPPAEKAARFSFRVVLATGAKGAEKKSILEGSFALGDLAATSVAIEVVPVDEKLARETPGLWKAEGWRKAVASFRTFQVVSRAGDAWAASKVFDLDGNVEEVSPDGRIAAAGGTGAAVQRGLGGLFGGGEESGAKGPGLEEVVLELELSLPGSPPLRSSRLLYGKLRQDVSPVLSMDLLVLPSPPVPEAFSWLAAEALSENAPAVERVATAKDASELRDLKGVARVPAALHSWELARSSIVGALLARRPELAYLPGPSVVADVVQLVPAAKAGPVAARRAIDVVFERGAFVPRAPEAAAGAAAANLFLGVAATAAESLALAEAEPGTLPGGPCAESQAARALGLAPAVRRAAAAGAGPAKPASLAAWSIARNERGLALVFPRSDGPATFWSVDPATGFALGRGETGEGQSAIEYLSVTNMNLNHLQCWLTFQKAFLFGGGSKYGAHYDYLACVSGADNPFSYSGAYFGNKAIRDDFYEKLVLANDGAQALVGIVNLLAGDEGDEGEGGEGG